MVADALGFLREPGEVGVAVGDEFGDDGAGLVVVRRADAQAPWAARLAAGYADPAVKAFVERSFGGAVVSGS